VPRSIRRIVLALAALGCASSSDTADSGAPSVTRPADHDTAAHALHSASTTPDSGFAAMQARGAMGMGVDQYTSTHTFEPLPDGGRITLRRDMDDSAGVAQIRTHLAEIARAFAAGDFTTPAFVHAEPVEGTDVIAARRAAIDYSVTPLPRGGALEMRTTDSTARDAIHRFLAYQRREHRAGDGKTPPPER
jgi:hypothetical protein